MQRFLEHLKSGKKSIYHSPHAKNMLYDHMYRDKPHNWFLLPVALTTKLCRLKDENFWIRQLPNNYNIKNHGAPGLCVSRNLP